MDKIKIILGLVGTKAMALVAIDGNHLGFSYENLSSSIRSNMKAVFPFCNIQHAWKTLSTTFYAQMDTFFNFVLYNSEVLRPQNFYNVFTTNLSCQVITGY